MAGLFAFGVEVGVLDGDAGGLSLFGAYGGQRGVLGWVCMELFRIVVSLAAWICVWLSIANSNMEVCDVGLRCGSSA